MATRGRGVLTTAATRRVLPEDRPPSSHLLTTHFGARVVGW
jgi:hypothetical protein